MFFVIQFLPCFSVMLDTCRAFLGIAIREGVRKQKKKKAEALPADCQSQNLFFLRFLDPFPVFHLDPPARFSIFDPALSKYVLDPRNLTGIDI